MENKIDVKKVMEHYEIYVNGAFRCSCDVAELTETIKEIEESL